MGLTRWLWRGTHIGRTIDTVKNIIDEGSVVEGVKRTWKEDYTEDNPLTSWVYSEGKYEGKKDGYIEASSVYNTKLLKQADAFLEQTKVFERERDKYEELLDAYEKEIALLMGKENKSEGETEYLKELLFKESELKRMSNSSTEDEESEDDIREQEKKSVHKPVEAIEEKAGVDVELISAGAQIIKMIKLVREVTDLNLGEAKEAVETAPTVIKRGVSREEADKMKAILEAEGAIVTFK